MNTSPRLRSALVVAFAIALFLGMALTPPSGDDAASMLQSLDQNSTRADVTGACRFLTSLLTAPALLAIASSMVGRGVRPFRMAAVLLHLSSFAGVVVFMQVVLHNAVLVPFPDRRAAIAVVTATESSLLWQISAVVYLLGLLVGFLSLGISLWRSGFPRLLAVCVGGGFLLHIAGGDWVGTAITGALVLASGLVGVGMRIARSGSPRTDPMEHDLLRRLVSDEPR